MLEIVQLALTGLIVLPLWSLLHEIRGFESMVYALLIKDDGKPQSGDRVKDRATGEEGYLLWRRWNRTEEGAMVDYHDDDRGPVWVPLDRLTLVGQQPRA